LHSLEEKQTEELRKVTVENDFFIKKNKEFEDENAKLQKEIQLTI
jgi:hypothetical protein